MNSPFPGMDPFIEDRLIWSDFHNGLAGELRANLNRKIRPNYFAALTPLTMSHSIGRVQTEWV